MYGWAWHILRKEYMARACNWATKNEHSELWIARDKQKNSCSSVDLGGTTARLKQLLEHTLERENIFLFYWEIQMKDSGWPHTFDTIAFFLFAVISMVQAATKGSQPRTAKFDSRTLDRTKQILEITCYSLRKSRWLILCSRARRPNIQDECSTLYYS